MIGGVPDDEIDNDECVYDGEVWPEHDYRLLDEQDGERSYECRRCGAETTESDDE